MNADRLIRLSMTRAALTLDRLTLAAAPSTVVALVGVL